MPRKCRWLFCGLICLLVALSIALCCVQWLYSPIRFDGAPSDIKISKQDDFSIDIYLSDKTSFHIKSDAIPLSHKMLLYRTLDTLKPTDHAYDSNCNLNTDSFFEINFGGEIMGISVYSCDEKYIRVCGRWGSRSTIGYTQHRGDTFFLIDSKRYHKLTDSYIKLVKKTYPERYLVGR